MMVPVSILDDAADLGKSSSSKRQEPRARQGARRWSARAPRCEGIDNIVHARTGALIVIGDPDELAFLFSGGNKLDIDYSPAVLYQLAKSWTARSSNSNATKIPWCKRPDAGPDDLHDGDGTRHRTAERVLSRPTRS